MAHSRALHSCSTVAAEMPRFVIVAACWRSAWARSFSPVAGVAAAMRAAFLRMKTRRRVSGNGTISAMAHLKLGYALQERRHRNRPQRVETRSIGVLLEIR